MDPAGRVTVVFDDDDSHSIGLLELVAFVHEQEGAFDGTDAVAGHDISYHLGHFACYFGRECVAIQASSPSCFLRFCGLGTFLVYAEEVALHRFIVVEVCGEPHALRHRANQLNPDSSVSCKREPETWREGEVWPSHTRLSACCCCCCCC